MAITSAITKIKSKLIISKIFYRHTNTNTFGCFANVTFSHIPDEAMLG